MGKLIISESTSPDRNYAIVEDGEVKVVLNESTKKNCHEFIDSISFRQFFTNLHAESSSLNLSSNGSLISA